MTPRHGPDRRSVALGAVAAALGASAAHGQMAGIEILASGAPGEGQDQLARAVAEGLGITQLTPRAIAVNVPRDVDGVREFVDGKRPRAAMMVVGLSTVGALVAENAADHLDGFRPLARLIGEPVPIVTQTASPFRTLGDLVAALRKDPGSVKLSGRAIGGADHQMFMLLARAIGVDPRKLSYEPAETSARVSGNLLLGRTMVASGALPEFLQQIRGGTFRALGVATPNRLPGLDIPTLVEQRIDVAVTNWRGVATRPGTGDALFSRLVEALDRLSDFEGWRQLLSQRHWIDMRQPAAEFAAFLAAERARVGELLRSSGVP